MRTTLAIVTALALSFTIPTEWLSPAVADETLIMEGGAGIDGMDIPGGCACRNTQSPPWHGSVAGDPCGPSCPPPNMFHANPCGQLWMKHTARHQGYLLPPCFPRMHGCLTEGQSPTPRPISQPRCPRCGAHIEGGF